MCKNNRQRKYLETPVNKFTQSITDDFKHCQYLTNGPKSRGWRARCERRGEIRPADDSCDAAAEMGKVNSAAASNSSSGGGDVCSTGSCSSSWACARLGDGRCRLVRCLRQRRRFHRWPLQSTTQLPLTLATSNGSEYVGASLWLRRGRRTRTQSPVVNLVGTNLVRQSRALVACCCWKRTRFSTASLLITGLSDRKIAHGMVWPCVTFSPCLCI